MIGIGLGYAYKRRGQRLGGRDIEQNITRLGDRINNNNRVRSQTLRQLNTQVLERLHREHNNNNNNNNNTLPVTTLNIDNDTDVSATAPDIESESDSNTIETATVNNIEVIAEGVGISPIRKRKLVNVNVDVVSKKKIAMSRSWVKDLEAIINKEMPATIWKLQMETSLPDTVINFLFSLKKLRH